MSLWILDTTNVSLFQQSTSDRPMAETELFPSRLQNRFIDTTDFSNIGKKIVAVGGGAALQ